MSITVAFKTDIGRKRSSNQDSYAVLSRAELGNQLDALLVVADGMGGGRGGGVASSLVVQTVPEVVQEFLTSRNGNTGAPIDAIRLLRESLVRANSSVWTRQVEKTELRGMGTTCVAAIVNDGVLTIGNVGDSRIYLLRDGKLLQMTEDHSEVWQQVMAGRMTREEAQNSPFRNSITKAIGIRADMSPDVDPHPLLDGDTVLLCSDGLTTELKDDAIARMLAQSPDAQSACDNLVGMALEHGGRDNITVVVMRYGDFTPVELPVLEDLQEEDEELTDPNQNWKQALSEKPEKSADAYTSYPAAERTNIDEEPRESRYRSSRNKNNTMGIVLGYLVVLQFAALIYLYWFHSRPLVAFKPVSLEIVLPTDQPLTYGAGVQFIPDEVRRAPLLIDNRNRLIVVGKSGQALRIDAKGHISLLRGIPFPAVKKTAGKPAKSTDTKITQDASGNIYLISDKDNVIKKYNPAGTETMTDIGKGTLKTPTDIAVDSNGNIFVIDSNHILKIPALVPNSSVKAAAAN